MNLLLTFFEYLGTTLHGIRDKHPNTISRESKDIFERNPTFYAKPNSLYIYTGAIFPKDSRSNQNQGNLTDDYPDTESNSG